MAKMASVLCRIKDYERKKNFLLLSFHILTFKKIIANKKIPKLLQHLNCIRTIENLYIICR